VTYLSVKTTSLPRRFFRPQPVEHMLSAAPITIDKIDAFCEAADLFESTRRPSTHVAGKSVSLLFFQPSTRTRLGFEAATVSLGCHAIGMSDMNGSRSNKRTGETLEDCGAVLSNLSDALVIRHHDVGAAARLASKSRKPVINAGDGWNEHPTQALIDIYAMRNGLGTLRGQRICFGGDPRGRTVRSLVHLLRLERPTEIMFCPPAHVDVPQDLISVLIESQVKFRILSDIQTALRHCDAIMMAPYDMSDIGEVASSDYVSPRVTPRSHVITAEDILSVGSRTLIYHPLPRQDEIDTSCDDLPNAMYFEQVRLSKFMRMAILEHYLL
jgi:aspartate carbamoyltransferase catalytic subunit